MAVKCTGKGSWSLISAKVTYRLEAALTPPRPHFRAPTHSLSALKHGSHGSLQKGPPREAHGKLTCLGIRREIVQRRKSQGQEKSSFQRITGKNWDPRQHIWYKHQHIKRHFPAPIKHYHKKETDQSVSWTFDLVAGLQVGCFML